MNRKVIFLVLALILIAMITSAWTTAWIIQMKANQTITLVCPGDEFLVDYSMAANKVNSPPPLVMTVTCRVWVR